MEPTKYLKIPVIGVTGSFGKTTVKETTAAVLSMRYNTYKSNRNFNLVGPTKRHVKEINNDHEAVVMEMAMSKKNLGKRQCTVIQPNIGVITAIGHAHFENFRTIEDVIESKAEMMKYMDPQGTLYLNHDDENCKAINTKYFSGEIVTVGLTEGASYRATNIESKNNGMTFQVNIKDKQESMFIPLLGEHSVRNALFAIAIADKLNLTPEEMREGLKKIDLPRGRLTQDLLTGNRILIDDSYNANPVSMLSGLEILNKHIDREEKIALLGDMAELGLYSKEGHEKVGEMLNTFNLDKVFLYGENSKWINSAAEKSGFPKDKLFHFMDLDDLIANVEQSFNEDSALFVKASNSTRLGKVVKHLLKKYNRES